MAVPIITIAQMRAWEAATWAAGRTEEEVIRRVGHIVADRALQLTRPGDLIVVLAGKGHNGDDARHASQNLADREVCLINVIDPAAARRELAAQVKLQPSLIVDGLFGIGLSRVLDAGWSRLVASVNASGVPILAVDVPSGIHADTGEALGTAVRASVTLTLGAPKKGLLDARAWPYVGRLEVAADIGLVRHEIASDLLWTMPADFAGYPPPRPVGGHKGVFGHVGIVAGSLGYHGAAVLAARGAQRAQPGLVSVVTAAAVYGPVAGQLQAAMVHPWPPPSGLFERCTAIVAGPGLAADPLPDGLKASLESLWRNWPGPMLVDASALTMLPPGPVRSKAIRVVTPHPGEAGRLLGTNAEIVQGDRPAAVREISRRFGRCWVVLKGHQTGIGRHDGPIAVNSSGNPSLAQGGSGDLLAGYLGGLLAQPDLQRDAFRVLRYGVWQHGAAADRLSLLRTHWTVEDLAGELGNECGRLWV